MQLPFPVNPPWQGGPATSTVTACQRSLCLFVSTCLGMAAGRLTEPHLWPAARDDIEPNMASVFSCTPHMHMGGGSWSYMLM